VKAVVGWDKKGNIIISISRMLGLYTIENDAVGDRARSRLCNGSLNGNTHTNRQELYPSKHDMID